MCHIFAGQHPATYAYSTRSVRLAGHATSIRLEAAFWNILDEVAEGQALTTPRFLSTLYNEALEIHGEIGNFTSLLRIACVRYLQGGEALLAGARRELTAAAAE